MLEGATAVVHGAGGFVGGAVARAFAREGAAVYLTGRTAAGLEQTAAAIAAEGGTAEFTVLDARHENAVTGAVAD